MKSKLLGVITLSACAAAVVTTSVHAQSRTDGIVLELNLGVSPITETPLYAISQTGPSTSDSLTWSDSNCTGCLGISAFGEGYVNEGSLGANVEASFPASLPAGFSFNAQSNSAYTDSLTVAGGTGNGVLALEYSVDGTSTESGCPSNEICPGGARTVITGLADAPTGTTVSAIGDMDAISVSGSGSKGEIGLDLAVGPQSETVTVDVPFTYGSAFSITPVINPLIQTPSGPYSSDVDFYNTMALDSALVYAGTPEDLGLENADAVVTSASGLDYGPDGVTLVPEPGALALFGLGLVGVALSRRRLAR